MCARVRAFYCFAGTFDGSSSSSEYKDSGPITVESEGPFRVREAAVVTLSQPQRHGLLVTGEVVIECQTSHVDYSS